jgi:hypothetical protein
VADARLALIEMARLMIERLPMSKVSPTFDIGNVEIVSKSSRCYSEAADDRQNCRSSRQRCRAKTLATAKIRERASFTSHVAADADHEALGDFDFVAHEQRVKPVVAPSSSHARSEISRHAMPWSAAPATRA